MAAKPKTRGSPKKAPPSKPKEKKKSQRGRFIETAREIGVDETGQEFERALRRVIPVRNQ